MLRLVADLKAERDELKRDVGGLRVRKQGYWKLKRECWRGKLRQTSYPNYTSERWAFGRRGGLHLGER